MKLRHLSNIIEKRGICVLFNVHRGFNQKYAFISEALIKEIPVTHRMEYTVFFDLPYDCFGIARTPLPKGRRRKISTSSMDRIYI